MIIVMLAGEKVEQFWEDLSFSYTSVTALNKYVNNEN